MIDGRKDLTILSEEARSVIDIWTRYANGAGPHLLSRWLNSSGIPASRGGPWSASIIRWMLRNPIYVGRLEYGKRPVHYGREARPGHEREQRMVPPEHRIVYERPDLRIIPEDLQRRVEARLAEGSRRHAEARAAGTGHHRAHPKYLLSGGLLVCPSCGGNFTIRSNGRPYRKVYGCGNYKEKAGTCKCRMRFPLEQTDREILAAVEGELRRRDGLIEQPLLCADTVGPDPRTTLAAERDRLVGEIDNLVRSVAKSLPAETIAPVVKEYKDEIARLEAKLASVSARPVLDRERLRAALEQRCDQWVEMLRSEHVVVARAALEQVLGPITFAWNDEADEPEWIMLDEKKADAFAFSVTGPSTGLPWWSGLPNSEQRPSAKVCSQTQF